jgi:hypothetical protein
MIPKSEFCIVAWPEPLMEMMQLPLHLMKTRVSLSHAEQVAYDLGHLLKHCGCDHCRQLPYASLISEISVQCSLPFPHRQSFWHIAVVFCAKPNREMRRSLTRCVNQLLNSAAVNYPHNSPEMLVKVARPLNIRSGPQMTIKDQVIHLEEARDVLKVLLLLYGLQSHNHLLTRADRPQKASNDHNIRAGSADTA